MKHFDYIVVGSGCAGAMAAQTLVEAGKQVAMLDVGIRNESPSAIVPNKDFLELRQSDSEQYKYIIGEKVEGVVVGELGKGAQLTPPRRYMTDRVADLSPLESSTFSPLESLSYGGLGISWGLQCWEFSTSDLTRTGLSTKRMPAAYEVVSQRIGISATKDAAANYTLGSLQHYQQSAKMDRNHELLAHNYAKRQGALQRHGLHVGRTPLALLTKDLGSRRAYQYHDMDFYTDNNHSAWRPWITVDELQKRPNFTYIGNRLVTRFDEADGTVTVHCLDTSDNKEVAFQCNKLILGSSALGSARIVARSLSNGEVTLPLLCNPHTYIPLVQPAMLGKGVEQHKLGLGELSYFLDPNGDDTGLSVASSYGYQSLMMFRMINQVPLDFASARPILQYLMSGIIIAIVQHPDSASPDKYIRFVKDSHSPTGDKLIAHYTLSDEEKARWERREKNYVSALRKLRVYAIKRVKTEHGSSVHYAGTLPFSEKERPLSLSPAGRVHGTNNIYVADSAGMTYLPAKGLTFSLLANAHLTAENVLNDER